MIEFFSLPFQFEFMQQAYLIAVIIALPTAILSCFLVLKGWALMGDAVSHAVLPGLVLAWWLGLPVLIGAFVAGVFCSMATGYLAEHSRVKADTLMGVVFSGMFGFGIVLFVASGTSLDLHHILFGNMLGVSDQEVTVSGLISAAVVTALLLTWKDMLLFCFDPVQARAQGLPVRLLHYGLLSSLSLAVVATLSSVGVILAIGLLITPGAIAFLLTRKFSTMLVLAVLISEISMIVGITLSFWIDSAPAPTIILILTVFFIAAFVYRQTAARIAAQQEKAV